MDFNKIENVTLKFVKNGVEQEVDFKFEDGKLLTREFYVNWGPKGIVPNDVNTFRELLRFMRNFTFNSLSIYKINKQVVSYEHRFDKTNIVNLRKEVEDFEEKIALQLFHEEIIPIINRRGWFFCPTAMMGQPTIAYIDKEDGMPNNVSMRDRDLKRLNVICKTFKSEYDLDRFVGNFISKEELKRLNLYRED